MSTSGFLRNCCKLQRGALGLGLLRPRPRGLASEAFKVRRLTTPDEVGEKIFMRAAKEEAFKVRRLTTPDEVGEKIFMRAAKEGWRPGALDHVAFFAVQDSMFLVGELNGETIASAFYNKFDKDYVYIGGYLVKKDLKKNGYGKKVAEIGYASVKDCNLGADSTLDTVPVVANYGMTPQWCLQCFDIQADRVLKSIAKPEARDFQILAPSNEMFEELVGYDSHVHVFPRPSFLEKWLFATNCHSSVAVNTSGEVVGYGVIRTTLGMEGEERGWRIGPLFADNSNIARSLYHDLCVRVAAEDQGGVITADVSYGRGFNPDSLKLLTELEGTPTYQMMRVYSKGTPHNMPLHKIHIMS